MKIGIFYVVYYTFLAGFFMLMLLAFFATLRDDSPTWDTNSNGIIGSNPGVGFRPMPPNKVGSFLTFISVNRHSI